MPGFGNGSFGSGSFGEWKWSRRVLFETIPEIYKQLDLDNGGLLESFTEGLQSSFDGLRRRIRDFIDVKDPHLVRTQYDDVRALRLGPIVRAKGKIEQIGIVAAVDAIQQFVAPTARFSALSVGKDLIVSGSIFPQNNRIVSVVRVLSASTVLTDPPLAIDSGPLRWELRAKVSNSTDKITVEVRSGDVSDIVPSWLLFDGFADFTVVGRRQFKALVDENQLLTEQEGSDGQIDAFGRFLSASVALTQSDVGKHITLVNSTESINDGRYEIIKVSEISPGDVRAEVDADPLLAEDSGITWAILPYSELDLQGTVAPRGVVEQEGTDLSITASGLSTADISSASAVFSTADIGKQLLIRGSTAGNDGVYRVSDVSTPNLVLVDQRSPTPLFVETSGELTWELRSSTHVGDLTEVDVRASSMIVNFITDFGIEIDTQESESRQRSWARNVSRWVDKKGVADSYRIVGAISGFDVTVSHLFRVTDEAFSLIPPANSFEIGEADAGRNGIDGTLQIVSSMTRLTAPTATFVSTDVGRQIRVTSAAVSGNNQLYTIGSIVDSTTVEFSVSDTATLPEANNGSLHWAIVRLYTNLPPLRPNFDEVNADLLEQIVETASNFELTFLVDKYCWETDFDSTARIDVLSATTPSPGVQQISVIGTEDFPSTPSVILLVGHWEFVSLVTGDSGTGDILSGTAPSILLSDSSANFDSSLVGQWIELSGATSPANNGLFLITNVSSSATLELFNGNAVAEAFPGTYQLFREISFFVDSIPTLTGALASGAISGSGDSIALVGIGVDARLTDAAALFTAGMVGQHLRIAGATSPGNNGVFLIKVFISSSVVEYDNAAAVAEAYSGSWSVGLGIYSFDVSTATAVAAPSPGFFRYLCVSQPSCDFCGSNKVLAVVEASDVLLSEGDVQVERLFERVVARLEEVTPIHVEVITHFRSSVSASLTLSATVEQTLP